MSDTNRPSDLVVLRAPRCVAKTEEEFIAYCHSRSVITERGCWEWRGPTENFRNIKPGQRGYAYATFKGKRVRLHRWMLARKLGRPLTATEQACHECDNPPCWNPEHLEPGTNAQNHIDGGKRKRMQGQTKTHCAHGHEFTPENTYVATGRGVSGQGTGRNCRICQRARNRRRWHEYPDHMRERLRRQRAKRRELLRANGGGAHETL